MSSNFRFTLSDNESDEEKELVIDEHEHIFAMDGVQENLLANNPTFRGIVDGEIEMPIIGNDFFFPGELVQEFNASMSSAPIFEPILIPANPRAIEILEDIEIPVSMINNQGMC